MAKEKFDWKFTLIWVLLIGIIIGGIMFIPGDEKIGSYEKVFATSTDASASLENTAEYIDFCVTKGYTNVIADSIKQNENKTIITFMCVDLD